jgi:hypothetical protein
VAIGFGGAALVKAFAPALTATVGQATGSATPGGARQFGGAGGGGLGGGGGGGFHGSFQNAASTASTVSVHLSAPVTISAIIVAVALAVLGGLIAGASAAGAPPGCARPRRWPGSPEQERDNVQTNRRHQGLPQGRATVHALRGVDLEIADCEWLAIQGPTGHGKSTCCRSSAASTAPRPAPSTSTAGTSPGCRRPR